MESNNSAARRASLLRNSVLVIMTSSVLWTCAPAPTVKPVSPDPSPPSVVLSVGAVPRMPPESERPSLIRVEKDTLRVVLDTQTMTFISSGYDNDGGVQRVTIMGKVEWVCLDPVQGVGVKNGALIRVAEDQGPLDANGQGPIKRTLVTGNIDLKNFACDANETLHNKSGSAYAEAVNYGNGRTKTAEFRFTTP